MFLGHIESALKLDGTVLTIKHPPYRMYAHWEVGLSGMWIPQALENSNCPHAFFTDALVRLNTAVGGSPFRMNPNTLPRFDNEIALGQSLGHLAQNLLKSTRSDKPLEIQVKTIDKQIFFASISAYETARGDSIISREEVGLRLWSALERAMRWFLPVEESLTIGDAA